MSSSTRANKAKNVLTVDVSSPTTETSSSLLNSIEKRLLEQRKFFTEQLKVTEDRIMQSIGAVSAEICGLRSELKSLVERQDKLEDKLNSFSNDIDRLYSQVSILENGTVSSDLILLNVPNVIDASLAVENILNTLCCNSIAINKVFRTSKNNTTDKSVPIIAKLKTPDERVKFFRSLAEFRKKNKRQLRLSDVGFVGDSEIVLRECLTNYNKLIYRSALEYKRKKKLSSVFSLRGNVYVRGAPDGIAVKIGDMKSLVDFVGGQNL